MAACLCKLRAHIVTADGFRLSPASHPAWWPYLTNVDTINMSDRMAFHMPWLWRMTCLTFTNSLEKISAILDYVNSMLPHMNAADHIGFLRQFNIYTSLKTAFSKTNRTLKLYWFVRYCHLPAAILNIWNFSRIPGWGQSNVENAGWNEAETVKNISHTKHPGWSSLTLPSGLAISGTRSHLR